jgi:hypothetical protein
MVRPVGSIGGLRRDQSRSSNRFAGAGRPIARRRDADVMAVLGIAWPSVTPRRPRRHLPRRNEPLPLVGFFLPRQWKRSQVEIRARAVGPAPHRGSARGAGPIFCSTGLVPSLSTRPFPSGAPVLRVSDGSPLSGSAPPRSLRAGRAAPGRVVHGDSGCAAPRRAWMIMGHPGSPGAPHGARASGRGSLACHGRPVRAVREIVKRSTANLNSACAEFTAEEAGI